MDYFWMHYLYSYTLFRILSMQIGMHGHSESCFTCFFKCGQIKSIHKIVYKGIDANRMCIWCVKASVNFCDTTGSKNVPHLTLVQQIVGCRINTHVSFSHLADANIQIDFAIIVIAIITKGYVQLKCMQLYIYIYIHTLYCQKYWHPF